MTEEGVPVFARDGSRVRIRQLHRDDRELWQRGFEHLGAESRDRRFLAAMPTATPQMVRRLTELDHHDRDAVAAFDNETGEGIGVARYVRDPQRPTSRKSRSPSSTNGSDEGSAPCCSRRSADMPARRVLPLSRP